MNLPEDWCGKSQRPSTVNDVTQECRFTSPDLLQAAPGQSGAATGGERVRGGRACSRRPEGPYSWPWALGVADISAHAEWTADCFRHFVFYLLLTITFLRRLSIVLTG
jgi:hypothetical protein